MTSLTVHSAGAGQFVVVGLPRPSSAEEAGTEDKGPSPIAPELKELAWGGGSFLVLLVLMRVVLVPKVKNGMQARYSKIRGDHESADAARAAARGEVADYERELAGVRAEAAARVDAARQTVEAERATAIAAANERIAVKRNAANAANDAAKAAAAQHVKEAVVDVSGRVAELATGRKPGADMVNQVVTSLMGAAK
jgi:F-type H+-transporting ATPase subunit b